MPKKGFYPKTLDVPGKQVAGSNPVGAQTVVGGMSPSTVPTKQAVIHGLGPVTEPRKQPMLKGEKKFGHFKLGKLRMSGDPKSHMIGARGNFKGKKVF